MDTENYTPKGIIRDLISMRWTLNFFLGKEKEYESLVKFLIERNYEATPPIKELVADTGIPYEKLSKFMKKLYSDLMTDEDFVMEPHEVRYRIWARSSYKGSVVFDMKNLPVIPRVGEKVELDYFQECCGTNSFYVKKIRHYLDKGCQIVEIELAQGDYNLFWHYRLDEAMEKMEVDWREAFWGNDYEMKKKLGIIPKWYYAHD